MRGVAPRAVLDAEVGRCGSTVCKRLRSGCFALHTPHVEICASAHLTAEGHLRGGDLPAVTCPGNFRAALLSRSPSRVERRRLVRVDPSAAVAGKNAHVGFSERRLGEAGRVSRASTTGGCCSLLRSHRLGIGVKLCVASQGTVYIVGKIPSCSSGGMRPMERRPSHFVPEATERAHLPSRSCCRLF